MITAIEHVKETFEDEIAHPCESDDELFEYLTSFHTIWKNQEQKHRWWTDVFTVIEVNGKLIGYMDAETTGDDSPRDVGWEFDPDSICYVDQKIKQVTYYTPVQEKTQ